MGESESKENHAHEIYMVIQSATKELCNDVLLCKGSFCKSFVHHGVGSVFVCLLLPTCKTSLFAECPVWVGGMNSVYFYVAGTQGTLKTWKLVWLT